ncbi:MAG: hypothetical protein ABI183_00920 [Polyangiaceae bacterium]
MNVGVAPSILVPICASCGVVAREHGTCESCAQPIARIGSPAQGVVIWAAMRASFTCRSCGFASPYDGIVLSDGVSCAQCGSYQRVDKAAWTTVLEVVHGVADLGGPDPEGRFPNPRIWIGDANGYAKIGVDKTFASATAQGGAIDVCPGFPVCKACKRPFDIQIERGITTAHCSSCQTTARYALPAELGTLGPKVVAIVAEEQRQGRVEARVHQGDAGIVTMTCPQCGAALRGDGASSTIECAYCHTFAFIPSRAMPKGPGNLVKPIVFFVAFSGPSSARADLEMAKPETADQTKKRKSGAGPMSREIVPLVGVDLAPLSKGADIKQWMLTIGLTVVALAVGYVAVALIF